MRATQRHRFKTTFALYRPSVENVKAVIAVPGCEAIPCRRRTTSNFDRPKSFIGQANQDNFDTSDSLRFPPGYDVRAGDKALHLGVWLTIAGDPEQKDIIPRQVAYVTITTPPKILSGFWSDGP